MKRGMKILRAIGIVLGALALVIAAGLFAASRKTQAKLAQRFEAHTVELAVPLPLTAAELEAVRAEAAAKGGSEADPLAGVDLQALAQQRAVERGKHLVDARYGCNICHGENLGGGVMLEDPAIGKLIGPNITTGRGSAVAKYTMADWDRIVRHGIKPDGTPAVMPSEDYFAMTDRELSDIVSYIRAQPPVNVQSEKSSFGPVGHALVALGKFPLSAEKLPDHQRAHVAEPPATADTAEFGAHLATTCTGCHRSNLAGGPMTFGPPNWPPAANLTPHENGLATWSFEDFDKAMTQGVRKDGSALREPMSHVLPASRAMTLTERKALWTYLSTLSPQATNP